MIIVSPIKVIGSIVYRTREALRRNVDFINNVSRYAYVKNCFSPDFNLWHMPGTPNELAETMRLADSAVDGGRSKFPALLNFMPITQDKDILTTCTYNLAFVAPVDSGWTTEKREYEVFDPLLRPVYYEFMNQIKISGYFQTDYTIPHRVYEVFTTGNNQDEHIKGRYGDYMDAIEIHSLKLTLKRLCEKDILRIENENSLIV